MAVYALSKHAGSNRQANPPVPSSTSEPTQRTPAYIVSTSGGIFGTDILKSDIQVQGTTLSTALSPISVG